MNRPPGAQSGKKPSKDPHAVLLPALKAGDPAAQSKFFDQVGPRVLKLLIGMFHQNLSRQDCEDLLIEAGLRFFRHIQSFDLDRGAKLETWFTTIATNAARDERRRRLTVRKRSQPVQWQYVPSSPQLQEFFSEALTKLTQAEREYLLLWRFGRGMPAEEIGEALNLRPGTVRKRKHDVLKKLQKLLRAQPDLLEFLQGVAGKKRSEVGGETQPEGEK